MSALGLGCSLIPGARWLCRRRMLRCLGLPRFTGVSSTRDSERAVRIAAIRSSASRLIPATVFAQSLPFPAIPSVSYQTMTQAARDGKPGYKLGWHRDLWNAGPNKSGCFCPAEFVGTSSDYRRYCTNPASAVSTRASMGVCPNWENMRFASVRCWTASARFFLALYSRPRIICARPMV
jgi:hypothetical protein